MLSCENLLNSLNISKQEPIVVAVSGGVDSMVLIDYLVKNNYNVILVHFNHQTRLTNLRDERLITEYAEMNNLTYYIFKLNIKKGNFHDEARKQRYQKLRYVARNNNAKVIATAHQLDDLAETILMKLTRGSNLYGYAGIHPFYEEKGFTYIKPLLYTTKESILKYATDNNVLYFDDETNYRDDYLRNRYRHTVMPILKQENPQLLSKILTYHLQVKDSANFIKKEALKYIKKNKIDLNVFITLDLVIQRQIIAILLEKKNLTINFDSLEKIRLMLLSDKPNQSYDLENNYRFIKAYNEAFLTKNNIDYNFDIILNKSVNKLPNGKTIKILDNISNITQETIKICYNNISLPLRIRTRKPGDVLQFKYGSKKLKDYLIDLKIPMHLRNQLMIITDNDGVILWVSNVYINETLGNENKLYILLGE